MSKADKIFEELGYRNKELSKVKYIASVSFGKDSLAMLLMLIEKKCKLDEVVFCDLGKEFKAIYKTRDKIKQMLADLNIKYTELDLAENFNNLMLKKQVVKRNGKLQQGYGICGGLCRYGTTLKEKEMSRYLEQQYGQDYREYIGIAVDETKRIAKERTIHKLMPLVDWRDYRSRLFRILLQ